MHPSNIAIIYRKIIILHKNQIVAKGYLYFWLILLNWQILNLQWSNKLIIFEEINRNSWRQCKLEYKQKVQKYWIKNLLNWSQRQNIKIWVKKNTRFHCQSLWYFWAFFTFKFRFVSKLLNNDFVDNFVLFLSYNKWQMKDILEI